MASAMRTFLHLICCAISASAGALFPSSLPFKPVGYSTLLFEMYGTSPRLLKPLDLSHFRQGLAAALAVEVDAISLAKTLPAHNAGHGILLPVKVAQPNARKAPAALSRAVERVGFTERLVGELKRKGFVMRAPDIHVVEPGATFVPLLSCGAAQSCAKCSHQGAEIGANGGCSWCASERRCLDSDSGICNRDEWDTRKCVVDKAATTIAVDESAEAQGRRKRSPSGTKQVSAVMAIVVVFGTVLLLIGMYGQLKQHFGGISGTGGSGRGTRVIDNLDFESIEEQLELAEFDTAQVEYSTEEANALLNIY